MSHAELQHTTRSPKWQPSTANCSPPSPSKHTHANTHILCKPQGPQYEAFIRAAAKYSEHAGFYETQESDIGAELGLQAPGAAVITNFKGAWVCHNAHKRYGPSQWVYITYYHRAGIVSDPPPSPTLHLHTPASQNAGDSRHVRLVKGDLTDTTLTVSIEQHTVPEKSGLFQLCVHVYLLKGGLTDTTLTVSNAHKTSGDSVCCVLCAVFLGCLQQSHGRRAHVHNTQRLYKQAALAK